MGMAKVLSNEIPKDEAHHRRAGFGCEWVLPKRCRVRDIRDLHCVLNQGIQERRCNLDVRLLRLAVWQGQGLVSSVGLDADIALLLDVPWLRLKVENCLTDNRRARPAAANAAAWALRSKLPSCASGQGKGITG
jgi:hypothetical protein